MQEKRKLKTFTIEDIRSWKPCYDPNKYLSEDWVGTVIDILEHKKAPQQDRLWVVCRENLIDGRTLRLFAVWCARQVQHLLTDSRIVNAIDVAERFASGEARSEELDAAMDAAMDAAIGAARDAAIGAARAAARAAAIGAAIGAAWDAARAAAIGAAIGAAWDAARDAQITKLIEIVKESYE